MNNGFTLTISLLLTISVLLIAYRLLGLVQARLRVILFHLRFYDKNYSLKRKVDMIETDKIQERLEFFTELVHEYLPNWDFSINNRLQTTLALTKYSSRTIEINKKLICKGDFEVVWDIVLHEVAHGLTGPHHTHTTPAFIHHCKALNTSPAPYIKSALPDNLMWKHLYKCTRCGKQYRRNRLSRSLKQGYARCGICKGSLEKMK